MSNDLDETLGPELIQGARPVLVQVTVAQARNRPTQERPNPEVYKVLLVQRHGHCALIVPESGRGRLVIRVETQADPTLHWRYRFVNNRPYHVADPFSNIGEVVKVYETALRSLGGSLSPTELSG